MVLNCFFLRITGLSRGPRGSVRTPGCPQTSGAAAFALLFFFAVLGPGLAASQNIAPPESGMTAIAQGHGPEVVLVHGSLGDYRQWTPICDRLKKSYRV